MGRRFGNTGDQARRDQERDSAVVAVRKAVDEGLAGGEPEPFDFRAFKTWMWERHRVD